MGRGCVCKHCGGTFIISKSRAIPKYCPDCVQQKLFLQELRRESVRLRYCSSEWAYAAELEHRVSETAREIEDLRGAKHGDVVFDVRGGM